jgi:hypothetical protein
MQAINYLVSFPELDPTTLDKRGNSPVHLALQTQSESLSLTAKLTKDINRLECVNMLFKLSEVRLMSFLSVTVIGKRRRLTLQHATEKFCQREYLLPHSC